MQDGIGQEIEVTDQGDGRGRRGKSDRGPRFNIDQLFDRLPPHSIEAEKALLGSLILDPNMIMEVIDFTKSADDFYVGKHGVIYKWLVEIYDETRSLDLVQLVDRMRDADQLKDVGGAEYLVELAEHVPSAANATHYARLVADKARLRRLIHSAGEMLYDAFHAGQLGPNGVREVLDKAQSAIFEIADEPGRNDTQALEIILQEELQRLEEMEGKPHTGIPTGFDDLDDKLSGLQPGEMIILAARPSMGKTALALNLAEQIATGGDGIVQRGKKVSTLVFSLEMSKSALAQRMISSRSRVDLQRLRTGQIAPDGQAVIKACDELKQAPLFIDDTPALTILQLRARSRRLVAQHGIGCIVIDYLQLLTSPGAARESRQIEVATISRGIKALARELRLPVVCLAQLNRGTEQREGNRPRMSDLRESGSIEQDADVVMLLHREEYYHKNDPDWLDENPDKANLAELIIAKQRNGPTGVVKLTWDNKTTRFRNHTDYPGAVPGGLPDSYSQGSQPGPSGGGYPQVGAGAATGGGVGSAFGHRERTGPAANHRDGGGPTDFDRGSGASGGGWSVDDVPDTPVDDEPTDLPDESYFDDDPDLPPPPMGGDEPAPF
ncbi:MAG: replicative DNA helicase [Planctomycetota bacterium]